MLATFDGPARAVGFALAMKDGVKAFALTIRAGVHTGEVALRDQDIGGLGVHIAARISGMAEPDEVLASRRSRTSPRGRASRSLIAEPTRSKPTRRLAALLGKYRLNGTHRKPSRRARACEHYYTGEKLQLRMYLPICARGRSTERRARTTRGPRVGTHITAHMRSTVDGTERRFWRDDSAFRVRCYVRGRWPLLTGRCCLDDWHLGRLLGARAVPSGLAPNPCESGHGTGPGASG